MTTDASSAIARLVAHNHGPTRLSKLLGEKPAYQAIQQWVSRGWASPMHIMDLEPFMPPGMTVRELYDDRRRAEPADIGAKTAV